MNNNFTLDYLDRAETIDPFIASMIERQNVSTYDEFINYLYKDLYTIISSLEGRKEHLQKDENAINSEIVSNFRLMGYTQASNEQFHNGRVDIYIQRKEFIWIGEAKVWNSQDKLYEGFLQLAERYSSGGFNQKEGGMLIYIFVKNARNVMINWATHLKNRWEEDFNCIKIAECPEKPPSFYSEHEHTSSGLPYKVRHVPIALHFQPMDKSARNSKKH